MPLLFNQDIAMLVRRAGREDAHFYRNAQADELVYVAKGTGTLETVFGDLPFGEGDYLVIHRGILHRYRFDAAASSRSCSSWRAAATSAGPSAIATSSASSTRARRTPSATSAARA